MLRRVTGRIVTDNDGKSFQLETETKNYEITLVKLSKKRLLKFLGVDVQVYALVTGYEQLVVIKKITKVKVPVQNLYFDIDDEYGLDGPVDSELKKNGLLKTTSWDLAA